MLRTTTLILFGIRPVMCACVCVANVLMNRFDCQAVCCCLANGKDTRVATTTDLLHEYFSVSSVDK